MNLRQFLKDIHATFFLFLVGDETKPEKTTEKSQNGENGKHNLDLLLLFSKIKQLNHFLLPDIFPIPYKSIYFLLFLLFCGSRSLKRKKMNVFEFSNTMFVTYLFDWAKRQGVFREKNMAYFFSTPTISIGTYCVIRYNSSTPFDAVKCSTFIDPSHLWNNFF